MIALGRTVRNVLFRTAAALALVGAFAISVSARPIPQPPADQPAPVHPADDTADAAHGRNGERRQPTDPAEVRRKFREGLQHRLERLQQALKMLDEGKSPEDVRQAIPDLARTGQRGEDNDRPGGGANAPQGRGAPAEPPHVLTAEDRQAVRDVLAATAPKVLTRLLEQEQKSPAEADRKYAETFSRMRALIDLRKRDPAMYKLRADELRNGLQARDTAHAIAELERSPNPDAANRQALDQELRTALMAQYDIRTQLLRADVEKRSSMSAETLEKTAKDMIARERRHLDDKRPEGDRRGAEAGDHRPPPVNSQP